MSPHHGLVVAATLWLAGCGPSIRLTQLAPAHPSLPPEAEIMVSSVGIPECPFEELGLVTVRRNEDGSVLLEVMKSEARRIGGHALVGLEAVPRVPDHAAAGLTATIVRFTDATCQR